MNLEEFHELTGKVLKERPELANFELEDCSAQVIAGIGQYRNDISKQVVTLLNDSSLLFTEDLLEEGEWACQLT